MNERNIDALLSTPLQELDDDGFSRVVVARALEQTLRRRRQLEGTVLSVAALGSIATLATTGAGALLARLAPEIIMSPAIQIGFVLTVASLFLARQLST